ncbi:MAG: tripartite tricarboxylate transporter substrate binding protein [Betaproteobacteria bacterium]|nr:tripartite tricarboxylate transporter substrate binding protein [Betaproteobacteria bacterium]
MRLAKFLFGALALCMLAKGVLADEYPVKPVTIVVPYPAGGVVDIVGRLIADKLRASLGKRVIVENRPGAGGTIGAAAVARATPDGYTLLLAGAATHVFAPLLYRTVPYDPVQQFAPITQLTAGPLVLVVNSGLPLQNMKEFLAYLKANGDRVNYASNGKGTFPHLAVELLKQAAGLNPTHVLYNGGPPAILALVSGDVAFSVNHIPNVLAQVKAGKIRPLATTGLARSSAFPDLPTFDESGFKGFETNAWFGLFAPPGTPQPIVERIWTDSAAALKAKDLRDRLATQGDEPVGSSPMVFAAYLQGEISKWTKVVREAGITPE